MRFQGSAPTIRKSLDRLEVFLIRRQARARCRLVFGHFALDQERRQLLRSGEPVPLEAKAFELLSLLLARRPRVLSKAQIRDVIWPRTLGGRDEPARGW